MNKDLLSGILLTAIGMLFLTYSMQYEFGNIKSIGPGFFPLIIAFLLTIFGLCILILSFNEKIKDKVSFDFKTAIFIFLGIFVFALTLESFGFIISTTLLILIVSILFRLKYLEIFLLVSGILIFNYFLFFVFLKIPFPLY